MMKNLSSTSSHFLKFQCHRDHLLLVHKMFLLHQQPFTFSSILSCILDCLYMVLERIFIHSRLHIPYRAKLDETPYQYLYFLSPKPLPVYVEGLTVVYFAGCIKLLFQFTLRWCALQNNIMSDANPIFAFSSSKTACPCLHNGHRRDSNTKARKEMSTNRNPSSPPESISSSLVLSSSIFRRTVVMSLEFSNRSWQRLYINVLGGFHVVFATFRFFAAFTCTRTI